MARHRIIGEAEQESPDEQRMKRIAAARADLARRYAANPEAVQQFEAKKARLDGIRRRERKRFEELVLGNPAEPPQIRKRPAGMSKAEWRVEKARLLKQFRDAAQAADRFRGKAATPETLAAVAKTHIGSLEQLERNGTITKEQREWAAQIANVYRSIETDVGVKVASLEARVDSSRRSAAVAERIHRVRMHRAYGIWRETLPAPKGLVLDMIVGDEIGYTVAAKRYRVGNLKAKVALMNAIDRWPISVARAFSMIDQSMVDAMNDARAPYMPTALSQPASIAKESYAVARAIEVGRDQTDEPYLLPKVDPVFLDDRSYLREWDEIAAIIRDRVAELAEAA